MQEIADLILGIIGLSIIFSAVLFFCFFVVFWCLKATDKETKYLETLSEEDKLVIINYKIGSRLKFFDTFKKGSKDDEDK